MARQIKHLSGDRNSIHYARLRVEHPKFFFFVIVPAIAILMDNDIPPSEKSWQTVSVFTSQFSLLANGAHRRRPLSDVS